MTEKEKNMVADFAAQVFNEEITEDELNAKLGKIEGGADFFASLIFAPPGKPASKAK